MDTDKRTKQLVDLCTWIGLAITRWQVVEDAHYFLFFKMLDAPQPEICSVIYFGPPSFEARRVMVDRVAHYAITDPEHKKEWKKLNSRLEVCAEQRGKVAHYGLDCETISTGPETRELTLGDFRLAPSKWNIIKAMKGKANERLTVAEIRRYIGNFTELEHQLNQFTAKIPFPQSRQGLGLLSGLSHFLGTEPISHLFPSRPLPPDEPPSEK